MTETKKRKETLWMRIRILEGEWERRIAKSGSTIDGFNVHFLLFKIVMLSNLRCNLDIRRWLTISICGFMSIPIVEVIHLL
jgi:hypothetical protein